MSAFVKRDCQCPRVHHEHGTRRAWERDGCRCLPCRAAHADATRAYRAGGSWREAYIPAVGTVRRLRALAAAGVTARQIADHTGLSKAMVDYLRRGLHQQIRPAVAAIVAGAYDALWDKGTGDRYARQCAAIARNAGWAPPLAWDDIDDPDAEPADFDNLIMPGLIDEIAVQRAVTGDRVRLTDAERSEAMRILSGMGLAPTAIADRLHIAKRTVDKKRAAA